MSTPPRPAAGPASDVPVGGVLVLPIRGVGEVTTSTDLADTLHRGMQSTGITLQDGDVLVVSSKVISKAQGLRVPMAADEDIPQREAVIRAHSDRIVAERRTPSGTVAIVASRAGPVLAAAGVDASNTGPEGGALLLPEDPDLAARTLYAGLLSVYAPHPLPRVGILITDTAGRVWREGQVDFALGACGLTVVDDLRGSTDADGRRLSATVRAIADEIAAAADLVKGKTTGIPAAVVRGLTDIAASPSAAGATSLLRSPASDWFALGTVEAVRAALGAAPGSPAAQAVGVASAEPEDLSTRLARVMALALLHTDPPLPTSAVRVGDGAFQVLVADPFLRGQVVARLQVARHTEGVPDWPVEVVTESADVWATTSAQPAAGD